MSNAVSPLAAAIRDLPSAFPEPVEAPGATPTTLSIKSLRIDNSPITPVSVTLDKAELDIPDAKTVGWYQYSAIPGAPGSSVLASHVQYDGKPGVFRYLTNLKVGDVAAIGYSDGSAKQFIVTEVAKYAKDQLPADRVWSRSGKPILVLLTCGGRFDESRRSFDDNIVAYAEPA